VQNEPDFSAGYSSMLYTSAEMVSFLKVLGPKLKALSPAPQILLPSVSNWDNGQSYLDAVIADSTAASYFDIASTHQYSGTVARFSGIGTRSVWQTEMSYFSAFDATMTNALVMAADIHSAITTGNVTAWLYWWLIGQNLDNEGLIGNGTSSGADTTVTKRLYALGNWSKFVRPGYVRIGTTGTVSNVSLTAFKNPSTGAFAVVAINTGAAVTMTLRLAGLTGSSVTPWVTDATRDLAAQAVVPVLNGLWSYSLPASSVTSFVGTGT
jgi:glucuronoarabinoxylan endo-1,4-beta-xylanase